MRIGPCALCVNKALPQNEIAAVLRWSVSHALLELGERCCDKYCPVATRRASHEAKPADDCHRWVCRCRVCPFRHCCRLPRRTRGWGRCGFPIRLPTLLLAVLPLAACVISDAPEPVAPAPPAADTMEVPAPAPEPEPEIAEPAPEPAALSVIVTSIVVNLRAGPGTDFAIAGWVHAGDVLRAVGSNDNGTWLQIEDPQAQDSRLWIYGALTDLDAAAAITRFSNAPAMESAPAAPTAEPEPACSSTSRVRVPTCMFHSMGSGQASGSILQVHSRLLRQLQANQARSMASRRRCSGLSEPTGSGNGL